MYRKFFKSLVLNGQSTISIQAGCLKIANSKAITKEEGPKNFLAAPKMVSSPQLPAVKKNTIFGAARNYFMMALAII